MVFIAGLIIGLAAGTVQFLLLSLFVRGVTGDGISPKAMACGIAQFFLPFVVLIGCALLLKRDLLPAGIGIVAALFIGVTISTIRSRIKRDEHAPDEGSDEGR